MNKKTANIFLIIFAISLCLQKIDIVSFSGFSLKLCHLLSLLFVFFVDFRKKIKLPSFKIFIFYFILILVSLINFNKYGIGSLLLNYIFGLYIIICLLNFKYDITKKEIDHILKSFSWIILSIVLLNCLINYKVILDFFSNPYGHPVYDFIFSGGANLEASWISMIGLFSGNDKRKYIYLIFTTIFSALLASRAGLIINILIFLYYLIFEKKNNKIFILLFISLIGLYFLVTTNIFDYIFSRFSQTGSDPGSLGRLRMWELFWPVLRKNPLGVGIGNSINALELYSGMQFYENNMHNLFMQMFIDLGIFGGLYYMFLFVYFFIFCLKRKIFSSFSAFIAIYLVVGCLQFRGGDGLFFFVLGFLLIWLGGEKDGKNFL